MSQRVNIYHKINELCSVYQQMLKGELSENGNLFYQDQFFNLIFPNLLALYQKQLNSQNDDEMFPEEKNSPSSMEVPEEKDLCLTKQSETLPENISSDRPLNQRTEKTKSQSDLMAGWELEIPKNKGVSQRKKEPGNRVSPKTRKEKRSND